RRHLARLCGLPCLKLLPPQFAEALPPERVTIDDEDIGLGAAHCPIASAPWSRLSAIFASTLITYQCGFDVLPHRPRRSPRTCRYRREQSSRHQPCFDESATTSNEASNVSSNMARCQTCKSFDFLAKFTGTMLSERHRSHSNPIREGDHRPNAC